MTVQPKGEALRQAVKWIAEAKKDDPNRSRQSIINEAGAKFNLSPKDMDFLLRNTEME